MPLTLIDGSSATIDLKINGNSYKCIANYWSADINRDFTEATTFCSQGWRSRTPGMKQLEGRMDGFAGEGDPATHPLNVFGTQAGVAFVGNVDGNNCIYTGTVHVRRTHIGLRAAANSEYGIEFESAGPVTVVWITA